MAFDLADLQNEVKETTARYLGREITIKYRPGVLTPAFSRRIQNAERAGDEEGQRDLIAGLIDMLEDWDIAKRGKKLPLEEESIEEIPMPLIGAMYQACFTDQSGEDDGEEAKNGSRSRSSRKGQRAK